MFTFSRSPSQNFASCLTLALIVTAAHAGETVRLVPIGNYNPDGQIIPQDRNAPSLAITHDGRFILASRPTANTTLHVYARDHESGKLEHRSSLPDPVRWIPSILGTSPDARFAFVQIGPSTISCAINGRTGELSEHEKLENLTNGIVGLRGIEVACTSPDGKSLYLAGHRDKTLVCFRFDPETGKATFEECLQTDKAGEKFPGTSIVLTKPIKEARRVEGLGTIRAMACSPDGRFFIAATDVKEKALLVFARDQENGRLVPIQSLHDPSPVTNNIISIASIAFQPAGTHVVVSSLIEGVSLLKQDPENGELSFVEAYLDEGSFVENRPKLQTTEGLKNTTKVIWTPDGKAVFAAGSGDRAIVGFRFDSEASRLTPVVTIRTQDGIEGLGGVSTLCISPDGRFLYSGSRDDLVTAFEIQVSKD